MQVLIYIMSRAVPNMSINSLSITTSLTSEMYYILVSPDHKGYWAQFKRKYPSSVRLAQEWGARVDKVACPEFTTIKNLLGWLSEVLGLTQGEEKLLYFDMIKSVE